MKKDNTRVLCTLCLEEQNAEWVVPGNFGVEVMLFLVTLPLLCIPALLFLGWQASVAPLGQRFHAGCTGTTMTHQVSSFHRSRGWNEEATHLPKLLGPS
jgi:hypothetical protein